MLVRGEGKLAPAEIEVRTNTEEALLIRASSRRAHAADRPRRCLVGGVLAFVYRSGAIRRA